MLRFELKKHWLQKLNLVTLLVLLLLLLNTFLGLKTTSSTLADAADNTLTSAYQKAYASVSKQRDDLDEVKPQTAAIKKREAYLDAERQALQPVVLASSSIYSNAGNATVNKARHKMIKAMLDYQTYTLRLAQKHDLQFAPISRGGALGSQKVAARKTDVRFYRYLLDHNLFEMALAKGNVPAANYLLNAFFSKLSPLMLLAFAALPAAAILTFERRRGTAGFASVLPVQPVRPLLIRVLAALIITLPLMAAALGLTYWLVGRTMGYGFWDYPLVTGSGQLITAAHAVAWYAGLLAAAVVMLVMLATAVAQLSASTGFVAVVCAGFVALTQPAILTTAVLAPIARFLPQGALRLDQVITGTTPWPAPTAAVAIVVLLAWAAVFLAAAVALSRRKQRVR
ncbi:hypothetical protein [Lacticaseibacillus kribbianus]|uniref:hypothetical protein n=1 Tax=Lacticaseibacillus kribbianus TaxID=2926292 RepID=UPI001CD57F8D|nr:hypothetical protein [Lacticaseibacillus kribbianus]